MVFQHRHTVGRKILTLGEGFTTQVVYPMVFQHSGVCEQDASLNMAEPSVETVVE